MDRCLFLHDFFKSPDSGGVPANYKTGFGVFGFKI